MKIKLFKNKKGLSIIEVIIATSIFVILVSAIVPLYIGGYDTSIRDTSKLQADMLVQQGLEAVRSIRDQNFSNLTNGDHGLTRAGGYWAFNGTQDTVGKFTRVVNVTDATRNAACALGGIKTDVYTKQVTVTVTWNYTTGSVGQESVKEYLANWMERGGCEEAANLLIDLSGAYLSSDEHRVAGITLQNMGNVPITIDKVKGEWDNGAKIEEVKMASNIVWKYNNTGSPRGRQSSGVELDVTNVVLPAHSGIISLDHFFFTEEMEHADFTFYVTMIDGSVRYEHIDNLHD